MTRSVCREAWAPELQRLEAFSEEHGPLGSVYLDLHARAGKYTGCAQFTLRCSKERRDGGRQLPLVALCFNFDKGCKSITFEEVRLRAKLEGQSFFGANSPNTLTRAT